MFKHTLRLWRWRWRSLPLGGSQPSGDSAECRFKNQADLQSQCPFVRIAVVLLFSLPLTENQPKPPSRICPNLQRMQSMTFEGICQGGEMKFAGNLGADSFVSGKGNL
jgi:hypothetical protein